MHAYLSRLTAAVLLALAVVGVPQRVHAQGAEIVIEWNQAALTTLGTPGASNPTVFFTRPLAMLHVAIFEAINSIDRVYTPYLDFLDAEDGASPDAAAAQAAHDVLASMFPSRQEAFAALLATQLRGLPPAAAASGTRVGAAAARAILERRANDGWNRPPPSYMLPSLPGYWQPVPPQNQSATFAHYQDVTPFVIASARQFLVEPPPALTSATYAADFNEVKAIGSANSTTRTADQTLVARLFAGVGTTTGIPAIWNNLTRELARARGMNGLDAARLFAFTNVTFHEALFVTFSGKFLYGLWRPVTAIRGAARDGNAATDPDPEWLGLLPSPPYPTYPGNYACLASAITRVFAHALGGDEVPFSITWAEANGPGWTRTYERFSQLAAEAAKSRVYGGIHFEFDTRSSFGVCIPLGDYIYENTFRRRFAP
jgi:hypothetical protein